MQFFGKKTQFFRNKTQLFFDKKCFLCFLFHQKQQPDFYHFTPDLEAY